MPSPKDGDPRDADQETGTPQIGWPRHQDTVADGNPSSRTHFGGNGRQRFKSTSLKSSLHGSERVCTPGSSVRSCWGALGPRTARILGCRPAPRCKQHALTQVRRISSAAPMSMFQNGYIMMTDTPNARAHLVPRNVEWHVLRSAGCLGHSIQQRRLLIGWCVRCLWVSSGPQGRRRHIGSGAAHPPLALVASPPVLCLRGRGAEHARHPVQKRGVMRRAPGEEVCMALAVAEYSLHLARRKRGTRDCGTACFAGKSNSHA